MSTLSSVIGPHPDDLAAWRSVAVRKDLQPALWHAKFWGQSMAIEEQAWRDDQLRRGCERRTKGCASKRESPLIR